MEDFNEARLIKTDGMPPVPELLLNNRHVPVPGPGSEPDRSQNAPRSISGVSSIEFENHLDSLLRTSLPQSEDRTRPMAQPHILHALLGEGQIRDLLTEKFHEHQVESLLEKICRRSSHSRVVILAMLILVCKSEMIKDVVQEGISDNDLPFEFDNASVPKFQHRYDSTKGLKCFNKLPTYLKGVINGLQWSLRTPLMEVKGPDFKPYKMKFDDEIVLPWTSIHLGDHRRESGNTARIGGYSAVYRCRMDDRFHGFHGVLNEIGLKGGKGEFALKVINPYSAPEKAVIKRPYEDEEKQLHNFNGVVHRHLVTLLATFTYKTKNHFLFPWAESDLFEFWQTQENSDPQWVSDQLTGLVGALAKIHNPSHLNGLFGRHGDMKPDNILWYTPYNGDKRGILVISDMGFTAVNTELSRSKQTTGKPRTPEYRAPELDVPNSQLSRKYDIWPLGCIFLEMMTWAVGGSKFVQEFKSARTTTDDLDGIKTPVFFNLVRENGKVTSSVVKPEVIQWMEKVRSHENSTRFIRDVVQVVKDKMMRPLANERATIANLQSEFETIKRECQRIGR